MNDNDNLNEIRDRIKARRKVYWIENGRDLIKAKARCPHGTFETWLMDNFRWSISTAQSMMKHARVVDKSPTLAVLTPSALGALISKSTPDSVRTEVVAEIAAGKIPTHAELKAKIVAAKAALTNPPTSPSSETASSLPTNSARQSADGATVENDLVKRLKAAGFDAASKAFQAAFPGYTIFTVLERDLKAA